MTVSPTDGDINYDTDTLTITDHGFTGGEIFVYRVGSNDPIGGLDDKPVTESLQDASGFHYTA